MSELPRSFVVNLNSKIVCKIYISHVGFYKRDIIANYKPAICLEFTSSKCCRDILCFLSELEIATFWNYSFIWRRFMIRDGHRFLNERKFLDKVIVQKKKRWTNEMKNYRFLKTNSFKKTIVFTERTIFRNKIFPIFFYIHSSINFACLGVCLFVSNKRQNG